MDNVINTTEDIICIKELPINDLSFMVEVGHKYLAFYYFKDSFVKIYCTDNEGKIDFDIDFIQIKKEDFNECFVTISEWRELQIKNILDDNS